jgi:glycerol-3-phosphate acyltransferase PlsX
MLDLGANADSTPEHLFEFAVMGAALANAVYNIAHPRVGLLNIGSEEIKGTERVKRTAQLLVASELNYIGFVEGNDIFSNKVDLVVSDGFAGNVALKTMEGLAGMIAQYIREEFSRTAYARVMAGLCWPVLKALRSRLDSRKYNGASFVGLRGIVVKSHGGADAVGFANAIRIALVEVDKQVPRRISHLLESQFAQRQTS